MSDTSRTIAALAATALAATLLAACNGGDDQPVELTFAAVTFTESGRGEALAAWVEDFNASQDDIHVEPLGIPFATFAQTVFTQIAGGLGPDLIRFDQADFAQAAQAHVLLPLEEYIDLGGYNFIEGPDGYTFVDDVRYGVMFEISSYALLYNAAIIQTPPSTFDELLTLAEEKTTGGVYGMAFRQTKDQEPGMMQDLFNYVYGFGGAFSDGEQLTLNSPEVVAGLEAYEALYDSGSIPRGADAATYRRMFAENLVGMMIDNGGVPGIVLGQNPELELAAVRNPFPVEAQGGITTPLAVNANTKHPEAAAVFVEWMLEPDNQVRLQQIIGAGSVATYTERSAEELEQRPYLAVYDSLTPTTKPQVVEGFEARTPELRAIIVDQVLRALHNEVTMQEAMDDAQRMGLEVVED